MVWSLGWRLSRIAYKGRRQRDAVAARAASAILRVHSLHRQGTIGLRPFLSVFLSPPSYVYISDMGDLVAVP